MFDFTPHVVVLQLSFWARAPQHRLGICGIFEQDPKHAVASMRLSFLVPADRLQTMCAHNYLFSKLEFQWSIQVEDEKRAESRSYASSPS